MKTVIENCLKYVEELFKHEYSGHDFFHTLRVYKIATKIAQNENANIEIVQLAALLHDVDDRKLSPNTYENKDNARKFLLDNNVDIDTINFICKIINEVSFKGNDSVTPTTTEGMCVQDADRLDAIGAIGIARAFTFGGNHNRVMHDPKIEPRLDMNEEEYKNHISTTINHFYEKLFKLKNLINTNTAKQIADSREQFMKDYISQFLDEWEGNK